MNKSIAYWMRLPFRLALKFLIVVAMFCYVTAGVTAILTLYKRNIDRAQDISTLYRLIKEGVDNNNLMPVSAWLSARPLAETDKLVAMLTPASAVLEPGTFFEIFRRELRLNRPEEALFWLHLGRYRLRYDILRCNADPERAKIFDRLQNIMPSYEIEALLEKHPEDLKKALQRVLDFDAKYPALDDPVLVCKVISPDLPVDDMYWGGYHRALRKSTEDFINSPDKEKK